MRGMLRVVVAALLSLLGPGLLLAADPVAALLERIAAVRPEGVGNPEAAQAWQAIARLDAVCLPSILQQMNDDQPVVGNWLRTAVEANADRTLQAKKPLPAAELEKFLLDTKNSAAGRRLAYELVLRMDPKAGERVLPGFLMDRSPELRRDAVALRTTQAAGDLKAGKKEQALAGYQTALQGACDKDQVEEIAKQLKALGVEVDLAKHFGFIKNWNVIAPFDNPEGKKFAVVYPPEKGVDLKAVYKGKENAECRWTPLTTADPYGVLNINKALIKKKGAIAYAHANVEVPAERRAEIRIGCTNALKVFLNGKEVFASEECHHGMEVDQYIIPVVFQAGINELLLKVCQNEQTEPWAQDWSYQARLCDVTGAAIPFTVK